MLLATDGLSDPFENVEGAGIGNGFEIELFIETADIDPALAGAVGDVSRLKESWAFEILRHVASVVADAGGINDRLDQYGAISLEFPGVSQSSFIHAQVPPHFVTKDDSIGMLIGAPKPDFPSRIDDMPLSPAQIVPIILITASDLEAVRQGGQKARAELVAALSISADGHKTNLRRHD